jgi:hypothetical protein
MYYKLRDPRMRSCISIRTWAHFWASYTNGRKAQHFYVRPAKQSF